MTVPCTVAIVPTRTTVPTHVDALASALRILRVRCGHLARWGTRLASVLSTGGRLLVAGNGGSAAEASHLVAELVGRLDAERPALSAIALHAEASGLTAIGNDYGFREVFARQVRAHGRAGDVFLAISTTGRSVNLVAAAEAARERGMATWALTGPLPNSLAHASDEAFGLPMADRQTVQELHLVVIHLLCGFVDAALGVPN